jgi:hypothetical protein
MLAQVLDSIKPLPRLNTFVVVVALLDRPKTHAIVSLYTFYCEQVCNTPPLKREAKLKRGTLSVCAREPRRGRLELEYAHQRYAKTRGLPCSLADLPHHTLIGADTDVTAFRMAQQAGFQITREIFQLRCANDLAQLAAMRAGYGIGGCHIGIARRDASLAPVLADEITFSLDMWLLTHGDLRRNKRVMALYGYLTQHLSAYVLSSQRLAG